MRLQLILCLCDNNKTRFSRIFALIGLFVMEAGVASDESTRLSPMWPGFDSRTRRHMWVEFVVGSLVFAPRGFSPDAPAFPSPQKPTILNSNSILKVSPI